MTITDLWVCLNPSRATNGLLVGVILCVLSACSAQPTLLERTDNAEVQSCSALFAQVDAVVEAYDVGNGGETKIAGFPFLRVNRVLTSFAPHTMTQAQLRHWMRLLAELDSQARASELRNLPPEAWADLRRRPAALNTELRACRTLLLAHADMTEQAWGRALAATPVVDDYSTWQRALGLYYLSGLPVAFGVQNLRAEIRHTYATPRSALPVVGRLQHLSPAAGTQQVSAEQLVAIMDLAGSNPLAIPLPNAQDRQRLFDHYAPEWVLDVLETDDQIGAIYFTQEQPLAQVNTQQPTVYRRISHTRFGARTLLQLNYITWFPARRKTGALDILGGHLDGIIWRVTLNAQGQPLIYDTVHNCGCYHLYFPTERVDFTRAPAQFFAEPPMAPQSAPELTPGHRLVLRIAQHTHFVDRVSNTPPAVDMQRRSYQFADYESLESLPNGQGFQSLFGPDGLTPGTQRAERYVLWPMGIPSPGAMRQWGRHATAFLGKRYFDDARLLESVMSLK